MVINVLYETDIILFFLMDMVKGLTLFVILTY